MVAKRSGGFNCDKETNDDLSKLWDLPTPAGQFCENCIATMPLELTM